MARQGGGYVEANVVMSTRNSKPVITNGNATVFALVSSRVKAAISRLYVG